MLTQLTTLDGGATAISNEDVDTLREGISGAILMPGDDGFAEATLIWNGMIKRTPGIVVRPASAGDVVTAVGFARDRGLEFSMKGGGHNIAGLALSDGGMTLDMSAMRTVDVDVATATARVGPGCLLGDVDQATQAHGLAATLGFVSETGVAGLTLGGGFGYLTRQFGYTVDDLIEVQLVLASGEVIRASRSENADLFWALRGGGGNFGVVTEFVFKLHEVGPEITGGLIVWSADEAVGVTELYRDVTEAVSRRLTLAMLMRNAPPAPWLPEDKHGRPIVGMAVCHTGSAEEAEQDLAPLRSYGTPWADLIERKPYAAQQSMLDPTMPKGMHYYWKSEFVPELSDQLLADYRAQFVGLEAPANQAVLFHIGGALADFADDDGAVGNRDARYVCVIQSMYPSDGPAEANRDWVRSAWATLRRYSTGGNYINFQNADESDDRIAESYRDNFSRLAMVKAKYDPGNLFRVNRNIRPG